ncbi:carbohydrate ABC transporter permease [Fimbriimonas ginsengisoli]|uniref:Binding-protein-dependent transport systems inner membrane component n=1 Tax=Fimbriimonas ginsengisoli Gsoil 348 TaxID=661478 RepID=A0A068NLT1_FIMGI|nr:sugar ABC transporter permease [Fimbriimonas ginsengisoli]AIE83725.1 binding-protein-dependent transport systems inner membrane component [Fimbriimonas ginsengisoli Gsoil 348]
MKRASYGWEFIAPAALLIVTFVVLPCVWGIGMSFTHYDAIAPARFAGVDNFRRLAGDPMVPLTLKRTALYVIYSLPTGLALGLAIALALNARWFKGRNFVRGLYFLPNVTSLAAVAFVWQWLMNPEFGLLNAGLRRVGMSTLGWLSDPNLAMPSVALVGVWQGLGFTILIYLSGLRGIPEEVHEAAKIDGAGPWPTFRSVTWPLLMPTTMFLTIMGVIAGFQVFQSVYIMTGGGPLDATRVYLFYIFQSAFQNLEFGYASAMAVLLFAIVMVLTGLQWAFYGRRLRTWQ